ncbi:MAG: type IX secretion system membrane protein PorP/SprF [Chitinophagales bacterium]|nr:type IX secretion system membrane protein PorP/SprF [Chitinophagales bacterium]
MKKFLVVTILFATQVVNSFGQDPEFTQFNSAPLHLNPALTGISYGPRFNLNYRNQYPSLDKGYVTYAASFDMHIDKLSGGIGVLFLGDRIAGGLLNTYSISLLYAYQLKLSKNFGIKIGVQGGYSHQSVDWARLTFSDQINPIYGFEDQFGNANPTGEQLPTDNTVDLADFGAGFVAFSPKIYGGVSVRHLTKPKASYTGDDNARLDMRIALHAGGDIDVTPRDKKDNLSFSPNVMFAQQSNFTQINLGTYFYTTYFYAGAWFRHTFSNSDAVMGVVGVKVSYVRVGYSYDYTVSKLQGLSGGAHEVSITFNMGGEDNSLNSKRNNGKLDCPNFLNF